ncbi:MAG: hypothetical protein KGS73_18160 [Chloroflexi bacterium]|nr:hypothetical protein [Chloroflexota bacterium]
MNIFGRSWSLFKSSWGVVRSEPSLIWFPVLSALLVVIASLLLLGVLVGVVALNPNLQQALNSTTADTGESGSPLLAVAGVLVLFVYYLLVSTIATYFATGMAGAALRRLDGHDTSFAEGIQIANSRLGLILGFAAIEATVGVVLSLLRNQRQGSNLAGNLLASLGNLAWGVATFLVIPVIADHPTSPFGAIKESTLLLRKTWGEQLIGSGGLGLIFGLLAAAVVVLTFLTVFLVSSVAALLWTALGVGVGALILLAVLNSTLSGIYKAAVYRYASQGQVATQFDRTLIQNAFHPKGATA